MNPEPIRHEKLLADIRRAYAEISEDADKVRADGMDVSGLLPEYEKLIAVLEGRVEGGEPEIVVLVARINAGVKEVKEFYDRREETDAALRKAPIEAKMAEMKRMVAQLRAQGGEQQMRDAERLEAAGARALELLNANPQSEDKTEDVLLLIQEERAKLVRHRNFRAAACGLYREQWPPERWARLSPVQRTREAALLAQWCQAREEILGSLPIEDRRRLEAMRGEDFEKPGAYEP